MQNDAWYHLLQNSDLHLLSCSRVSNKRQRCPATESQQPDSRDSNPEEHPQVSDLDWRKFRANLIASEKKQQQADRSNAKPVKSGKKQRRSKSRDKKEDDIWAHQISAPETGCLLFPRRSAGDLGFFNDAVILMLRHGR